MKWLHHTRDKRGRMFYELQAESHKKDLIKSIIMLRAKPLTKLEIANAHVQPTQNAFKAALVDHAGDEATMRSRRNKEMKKWETQKDDDLYDLRREYLDQQRKFILLSQDNTVLTLNNLPNSAFDMRKTHDDKTVKAFKEEKSEYSRKMKLHEKRFDFNTLQYTYIEAREEMMHHTYIHMDEAMKKVKNNWKGYHEYQKENLELEIEIDHLKEQVKRMSKTIRELKDSYETLKKEFAQEVTKDLLSVDDDFAQELKKKRKTGNS